MCLQALLQTPVTVRSDSSQLCSQDGPADPGRPDEPVQLTTLGGAQYNAAVQNGHVHGRASLQLPGNVVFDGCIANSTLTGPAVVTYSDTRYFGMLTDGQYHGDGVQEAAAIEAAYEGVCRRGPEQKAVSLCHVAAVP